MIRVGLTGGIGSGKSTVAEIFSRLGVPVFYADKEAKNLMASDPEIRQGIIAILGHAAYDENGIDTELVAGKIFKEPLLLRKVNALVHPAVYKRFLSWCDAQDGKKYVIHEAAVLIESGGKNLLDYIILVTAPEKNRIERVVRRDGVNEEKVRERIRFQLSDHEKAKLCDFIIDNGNDVLLIPQVLQIHEKLISLNH
jgi:dephospho-CoA kinase